MNRSHDRRLLATRISGCHGQSEKVSASRCRGARSPDPVRRSHGMIDHSLDSRDMSIDASDVAAALREYAFWLERGMADPHRIQAYRRAAAVAAEIPSGERRRLTTTAQWKALASFGPSTAEFATAVSAGIIPEKLEQARVAGTSALDGGGAVLGGSLRGDLHCHTDASDGGATMGEMAEVADRLGRDYLAITDHSPRLRIANGLSRERLLEQWSQMESLQENHTCTLLRGIEVDILASGALDQSDDMLAGTDVVVASVHSDLRAEAGAMTHRMVAAVSNPNTLVLGHCTGRRLKSDGRGGLRLSSTPSWSSVPVKCLVWQWRSTPGRSVAIRPPDCWSWLATWAASSPSTPTHMRRDSSISGPTEPPGRRQSASERRESSTRGRSRTFCSTRGADATLCDQRRHMRLHGTKEAGRPHCVRRPGFKGISALDAASHETAHEEALQSQEHDHRDDHRHECACAEQVPLCAEGSGEFRDADCQRSHILASTREGQGNEQVVPDPEELEDGERRDCRHQQG